MDFIYSLLLQYRYLILFPLAAVEGPLVALAVGFFVQIGYFSFFPAYIILLFGDIVPDTIYYYLGRMGNKKQFIEKYGSRSKLLSKNFEILKYMWQNHGRKTMFFGKLAYGLSIPFLISAGIIHMPYRRFLSYAIPVTLFQYGVLMLVGYYLGYSYKLAIPYVQNAYLIIAIGFFIFLVGYVVISYYARRQFDTIK